MRINERYGGASWTCHTGSAGHARRTSRTSRALNALRAGRPSRALNTLRTGRAGRSGNHAGAAHDGAAAAVMGWAGRRTGRRTAAAGSVRISGRSHGDWPFKLVTVDNFGADIAKILVGHKRKLLYVRLGVRSPNSSYAAVTAFDTPARLPGPCNRRDFLLN